MDITLSELVRLVAKREGIDINTPTGPTELADRLELGGRSPRQTVQRWRDSDTGTNANPRFASVIMLLDRAGMLRPPTTRRVRRAAALDEQELAAAIRSVADALRRLERLADQQEPPEPATGTRAN